MPNILLIGIGLTVASPSALAQSFCVRAATGESDMLNAASDTRGDTAACTMMVGTSGRS